MKERNNTIFKIVIAIAVSIIAGSIFYHYVIFFPQQQEMKYQIEQEEKIKQEQKELEREAITSQKQIEIYKVKFQADCEKKLEKLSSEFINSLEGGSTQYIDNIMKIYSDMCKEKINFWSIDEYVLCQGGKEYINTRESYVPKCIEYKMEEINLTP